MPETCSINLLCVPEFDAIAKQLAATAGVSVVERGDYRTAQARGEIVLRRADVGVGEAVWFGALTGGITGTILEFSDDVLRLAPVTARP